MKVKNIHVSGVSKLKLPRICNNNGVVQSYNKYMELYEISKASFIENLSELDEAVLLNYPAKNIYTAFQDRFTHIYELWKEMYPCNILYTGADTLCIKPTEIFNKYNSFKLFAGPSTKEEIEAIRNCDINNHLDIFPFNCDIRYYPHTLTEDFWQKSLSLSKQWNSTFWHFEQNIYNKLYVDQEEIFTDGDIADITLAFQWPKNHDPFSGAYKDLDKIKIIHFHSSKSIQDTINRAKGLCEKFNIKI